eukprot:TRINITY_DN22137_c0_g1_i1.p1 TRINITY_DN22137_c0_g1~~TRINITY_DN22137_c0_g1_i1.p1  ORF type:complete len:682 (+),score=91.53 TRINITY_DN22137_c0_g1_i1:53-2098(+)
MPAPITLNFLIQCQNLAVIQELGNVMPSVIIEDVEMDMGEDSIVSEVGRTEESEGASCSWEQVMINVPFDARRGLKFTVMNGLNLVGNVVVGVSEFYIKQSPIEVSLSSPGMPTSRGTLTLHFEEPKEYSGEVWLSATGTKGGKPIHADTTRLCLYSNGVLTARSPAEWPAISGQLSKYSTGKKTSLSFFKNWKTRWCRFSRPQLQYFESSSDPRSNPKGTIELDTTSLSSPYSVIGTPNPSIHKEIKDPTAPYFAVSCEENSKQKTLTLLFKAESNSERDRWVEFLQREKELSDGAPSVWPVLRIPIPMLRGGPLEMQIRDSENDEIVATTSIPLCDLLQSRSISLEPDTEITLSRIKRKRPSTRSLFVRSDDESSSEMSTQIRCILAVDFTASNRSPGQKAGHHSIDSGNQNGSASGSSENTSNGETIYLEVARHVHAALLPYSKDNSVHGFGFGAKLENIDPTLQPMADMLPPESERLFCLDRQTKNPVIEDGYKGIVSAYTGAVSEVQFFGPKNLAPIIDAAISLSATHSHDSYSVCTIITCGDPHDVNSTIDSLVEASKHRLTVIIVGIGSEPFTILKELSRSVDSPFLVSPSTRDVAVRNCFKFVRTPPKPPSTTHSLMSYPSDVCRKATNNPFSSVAEDMSSAIASIPLHVLDYERVSSTTLSRSRNHSNPPLV